MQDHLQDDLVYKGDLMQELQLQSHFYLGVSGATREDPNGNRNGGADLQVVIEQRHAVIPASHTNLTILPQSLLYTEPGTPIANKNSLEYNVIDLRNVSSPVLPTTT